MKPSKIFVFLMLSIFLFLMAGCDSDEDKVVYIDMESAADNNNPGTDNSDSGPDPSEMTGAELYDTYCGSCHGSKENNNIIIKTADEFKIHIDLGTGGMGTDALKALTEEQLIAIADYLNDTYDAVALYTGDCSSCHGVKERTNIIVKKADEFKVQIDLGMGTGELKALTKEQLSSIAGYLTDTYAGATLYNAYCGSCHGNGSASTVAPLTLEAFKTAMDSNIGGMDISPLQALTDEELQAIVDYLIEFSEGIDDSVL